MGHDIFASGSCPTDSTDFFTGFRVYGILSHVVLSDFHELKRIRLFEER
ncbi:MAG: hypothetical protein HGB34_02045 [Candidatus Moranbacteria bacterium]|nr:hypothetical protein [Candidatus Moranbacteria bacterium]